MINVTKRFLEDWLKSLFMHAMASDDNNENYRCELELTPKAIKEIKAGRKYLTVEDIKVRKIQKTHKAYEPEDPIWEYRNRHGPV